MSVRTVASALSILLLLLSGPGSVNGQPTQPQIRVRAQFDRPRDLDPIYHTAAPEYFIFFNIYNHLVRWKPGGTELEPDLAERWERSPDGRVWTFYLRKGVQFQKGYGELTAEDVKYTFERFSDKSLASPYAGDWVNVPRIEAVDRYTVRFTLAEPNFVFVANPIAGRSAMVVSRKAVLEKGKAFSRDPIGTGPFAFESWSSADEVTVVAHDRYFQGPPQLSRIVFVPIKNFPKGIAEGLCEKDLARARVGLVGDDIIPLAMYRELAAALPDLILDPADDLAVEIRLQKSEAELALLQRAADVCRDGYMAALPTIRNGASEREVCAAGIAGCIAAGANFVRYFRTNSGPHSALGARCPQATGRVMRDGDLVCLDMIGAYWGHQFDVLRTTVVGRRPTDRQRLMLETALAAIDAARPGVRTHDLVAAAHRVLEKAGFGAYARPMIGHGIGYETFEAPLITASEETVLRPGMVLCVKDEIVVREGAPELLSTLEARLWE